MNSPEVSVIVPVYNTEKHLNRCVESIVSQTYSNWELILVDDGSRDKSGKICDEYADSDERIRTVHKQNGGVSSARNCGIEHAKGRYITFVDADDYIYESFLEEMLSKASADLIICGFDNSGDDKFSPENIDVDLHSEPGAVYNLVNLPYYLDTPWCKLFRKDVINTNNVRFNQNMKLSEDTLFSYQYLSFCQNVKTIGRNLYFYDGVWGGDGKYELGREELEYISRETIKAIDKINAKFGIEIDTRYKCFHLSKLKGLFTNFTDRDIHDIYLSAHPPMGFYEFLGDNRISPLTIAILWAERKAKAGELEGCRELLSQLLNFLTVKISQIQFKSKKQKYFYTFLSIFGPRLCTSLLKIKSSITA